MCGKPAKYIVDSPDGFTDYFCSKEHYEINRDYHQAKGIFWRESTLKSIK